MEWQAREKGPTEAPELRTLKVGPKVIPSKPQGWMGALACSKIENRMPGDDLQSERLA